MKHNKKKGKNMAPLTVVPITVSKSNLNAQVGAMLYAWGVVKDSEEIVDIEFSKEIDGLIPIKIFIREQGLPTTN